MSSEESIATSHIDEMRVKGESQPAPLTKTSERHIARRFDPGIADARGEFHGRGLRGRLCEKRVDQIVYPFATRREINDIDLPDIQFLHRLFEVCAGDHHFRSGGESGPIYLVVLGLGKMTSIC